MRGRAYRLNGVGLHRGSVPGGGGGGRPEAADVTQDAADDEDADDSADGEDLRKRQLPFSNRGALLRFNIEGRHTMV